MLTIDYGRIEIKLKDLMKKQGISINKLACRAEMQRTQLKSYINNEVQRVDLSVLSRICYVLECNIEDILEFQAKKV